MGLTDEGPPLVALETSIGPILVEINISSAPVTAENFLSYVDNRLYDGASFYRSVRPSRDQGAVPVSVIQGGLHGLKGVAPFAPITHEATHQTGLRHVAGTLSMARNHVGSADTEFFIVVEDSLELDAGGRRQPDGHGFAAFGRVVAGFDVVKAIAAGRHKKDPQVNDALEDRVAILSMRRSAP